MPEGDAIFKTARTLNRALAGQRVTRFRTMLVHLARVDTDNPIAGRTVESVNAAGKHLLISFSGHLVLRTHMRMNGSWHIYRPGERWQLPASAMRIVLETDDWVAVAFRVHAAEFVRSTELSRHRPIATLGPDLLSESFDAEEALRRMKEYASTPIADALINQRVVAGVGNVYKSEVLFLAGINPGQPVASVEDAALANVIAIARRLLLENVAEKPGPAMVTYRGFRRTTGPQDRLWVYSRAGLPCRKCGTPIVWKKTGDDARVTYWCPKCQPMRSS
ncbi:MAG TPA: DNA-formamidopyrimidine glycosylase family protein [Vicinamibacterales bacterium]|nr:DNA-formamidopyrimidine glycosylase family protein [Vicinamibacterales bacterium]